MLGVRDLAVTLAGRTVVDGVSLTAAPGEVIALLGPNGAGKSTLLRAIAGLVPATGTVIIDGTPLAALTRQRRSRTISWLAQGGEAAWPISVSAVVALGRMPHGGPQRDPHGGPHSSNDEDPAVARAMAAADVADLADRPLHTLSGGERARALLARALAVEAPLLLADEPVAALDPFHQLQVMETLRAEARSHGRTVIAVLHDLTLALRFTDRVILMRGGRLIADRPTAHGLAPSLIEETYSVTPLTGTEGGEHWAIPWIRV